MQDKAIKLFCHYYSVKHCCLCNDKFDIFIKMAKIDQNSDFYSEHYVIDENLYKVHYNMFFKHLGAKILDVGSSTGNFLLHCPKGSAGVDADIKSIEKCREIGLNAEVVDLDAEKLPYKDNEFDAVNFISTIEHLKNPLNALFEIKRVLKPNGYLLIRAKNVKWWKWDYWNNYNQYTMITKESMRQFLEVTGFKNYKISYIDRGTPFALKLLNIGFPINLLRKWTMLWGKLRKKYIFTEVINAK